MKKQYYVYALVDLRDGHPFYIGKGNGKRRFHHVRKVETRILADGLSENDDGSTTMVV